MLRLALQLQWQIRRAPLVASCTCSRAMHSNSVLALAASDRTHMRHRNAYDTLLSDTPVTSVASAASSFAQSARSAQGVSRAFLSRLRQLSVSGTASLDAFARALRIMHNESNPQRAWEVWLILERAQPPGMPSISRKDDKQLEPSTVDGTSDAVAVAASSLPLSPLAPTAELYNLAIQALCVQAKRADREHAKHAFHLFQRMIQLGFRVQIQSYRDLMIALSGCGYPRDSGLEEVYQQCRQEALASIESGALPGSAGSFSMPIAAFESMLFALTASAPRPAKVALWSARVANVVRTMTQLGSMPTQSTLNSQMIMAVYARDIKLVQSLWTQMNTMDMHPNRAVLASLIRLYSGQRGMEGERGGGAAATQLTPSDLQQVLSNIPKLHAVFQSMANQNKHTPLPPTPAMMEAKIEGLMRAYAARKAEQFVTAPTPRTAQKKSSQGAVPTSTLDPIRLLQDLLQAYSQCEKLSYALSKHAYVFVFCALTEVHAHQESNAAATLTNKNFNSASSSISSSARKVDVALRMRELTNSMQRAGVAPLPHMLIFSFQLLAAPLTLESAMAHSAMLALIQQLLRLSQHRLFILQGVLSTESDMQPLSHRSLDDMQLYRRRCTPAMLTQFVCSTLVFGDFFSLAAPFDSMLTGEPRHAIERRNQKRLTPAQQLLLMDINEDEFPVALASIQSEGHTETVSSFDPDSHPLSLATEVFDSARLLVAETLRSMLTSLRPRQLARASRLSAVGLFHLRQLVEAMWEGAGLFDVREQLLVGHAGGVLTHSLLSVDHPHAGTMVYQFISSVTEAATVPTADEMLGPLRVRTTRRSEMWVNSAVSIESIQYLLRTRAPLSAVDSFLLRLDQSPESLSKWTFDSALFYRGVFVAFARHNQVVKVMVYFQRMLHITEVDDLTLATLTQCVDRSGDRHALEELTQGLLQVSAAMEAAAAALERSANSRSASSSSKSSPAASLSSSSTLPRLRWSIGPLTLDALVRSHVHLDAFAGSRASIGFAPSRTGDGTLDAAVSLLEHFCGKSPVQCQPSLPLLVRLLKCTLLVCDETSTCRLIRWMQEARKSILAADSRFANLAAVRRELMDQRLDNSWPTIECGLDAPSPFLMQMSHDATSPSKSSGDDHPDLLRFASIGKVGSLLHSLRQVARNVSELESATNGVEWQLRTNYDRMAAEAARALAQYALCDATQGAPAS